MWKLLFLCSLPLVSALYNDTPDIIKLTEENFESETKPENQPILINIYSEKCTECKKFVKHFKNVAADLKEVLKFAVIDADNEAKLVKALAGPNKGHHKLYLLKDGEFELYQGPPTARDLMNVIMNSVLTKLGASGKKGYKEYLNNVIEITDEYFDSTVSESENYWMILFYNPLEPESHKMIALWYQAAHKLKGQVMFASIDSSLNEIKAAEYNIGKYPTAVLKARETEYYLHYNVHLTGNYIAEWTLNKIEAYEEESDLTDLVSQLEYKQCLTKPVCIISFLPSISKCSQNDQQKHLDLLQTVCEKYKDYKWGWLWTENGLQPHLENSLDIAKSSYPTLVVINAKKKKFLPFTEPFSQEGMDVFLQDILLYPDKDGLELKSNIKIYDVDTCQENSPVLTNNNVFDFYGMETSSRKAL